MTGISGGSLATEVFSKHREHNRILLTAVTNEALFALSNGHCGLMAPLRTSNQLPSQGLSRTDLSITMEGRMALNPILLPPQTVL